MKERICAAGNVLVPALLALRAKGYEVTWTDSSCVAESATQRFIAEDFINLLGVVAMREVRGPEWHASDDQIESFVAASGLDGAQAAATIVEPATARHLQPFVGGTAQLWDYSPSRARLVLLLQSADQSSRGYLVFVYCSRIRAPAWWRLGEARIETTDGHFELVGDDVSIACEELIFQNNYVRES